MVDSQVDEYKDDKKRKAEGNPFAIFELQDPEEFAVEKKRLFHIDMQGPVVSADCNKETKLASGLRLSASYDNGIVESKE